MKCKQIKATRSAQYITAFVSLAVFCLIVALGITVISQSNKKIGNEIPLEQSQAKLTGVDEEVQQLIEVLKKKKEPSEVVAAIKILGDMKAKEAIPELIKYLDYEKKYNDEQPKYVEGVKVDGMEIGKTIPLSGRYPATIALFQIGKPALPALVQVIEENEVESVKSENALYTIQFMFRDDLSKSIKYLKDAMNNVLFQDRKSRLANAVEKTNAKCRIVEECRIKIISAEQNVRTSASPMKLKTNK